MQARGRKSQKKYKKEQRNGANDCMREFAEDKHKRMVANKNIFLQASS